MRQTVAFGAENQRQFVDMVLFAVVVVQTTNKLLQRNGIVFKGHRNGGEPKIAQFLHAGEWPVVFIISANTSPRNLKHRAHRHAGGASIQWIAAGGRHQHCIDVQRGG